MTAFGGAWRQARREVRYRQATGAERHRLTEEELDSFLEAADRREAQYWNDIEAILNEIAYKYPVRVSRMKKDLRWLRKYVRKHRIPTRG